MIVGSVRELWRYPVKSFQGERCETLALDSSGFDRDRRWAVVDNVSGKTLTAKTVPAMLFATARSSPEGVVVALPDGTELDAAAATTSAAISAWLERDCRLVPSDQVDVTSYDMTFEPTNDDAELVDIPINPGAFFDLTPVHALTSTSLATMRAAHADGNWDVRRFRPNVLIDTSAQQEPIAVPEQPVPPGIAHPGFPEDGWVGSAISFGGSASDDPAISVLMATVRCALPNRAQPWFDRDIDIFRTMNAHHGNHLGVYCTPLTAGTVRAGDDVHLVDPRQA